MTNKPKPLTKAEWEYTKQNGDLLALYAGHVPLVATLDALFVYRERTRDMYDPARHDGDLDDTDDIAAELGIE